MSLSAQYPNLELLEYKVVEDIKKVYADKITEFLQNSEPDPFYGSRGKRYYPQFDATVFPQVWGSTCGGMDISKDSHRAVFAGQAMTKMYTTVFYENQLEVWIVCFGDWVAYAVDERNEAFLHDLKEHTVKSCSDAILNHCYDN